MPVIVIFNYNIFSNVFSEYGNMKEFLQVKAKCAELRKKDKKELKKLLEEFKHELMSHRVAKVTGGSASKLSKM